MSLSNCGRAGESERGVAIGGAAAVIPWQYSVPEPGCIYSAWFAPLAAEFCPVKRS